MPELPDIEAYRFAIETLLSGAELMQVLVYSPFLVRTFDPPLTAVTGRRLERVQRVAKRIAFSFDGGSEYKQGLYITLHLMRSGRLHWSDREAPQKKKTKATLADFRFDRGTLRLTEASKKKRASLHVGAGPEHPECFHPGGLEPLEMSLEAFSDRILEKNHTLKRFLSDQRIIAGIGNAYSDEILLHAGLSPLIWSTRLDKDQIQTLYHAIQDVLNGVTEKLISEVKAGGFPSKVTAFRKDMAAHGKYGQPCPKCKTAIQRIVYSEREVNYCPRCQTEGKLLADRSLSRLLKDDWPKRIEDLE